MRVVPPFLYIPLRPRNKGYAKQLRRCHSYSQCERLLRLSMDVRLAVPGYRPVKEVAADAVTVIKSPAWKRVTLKAYNLHFNLTHVVGTSVDDDGITLWILRLSPGEHAHSPELTHFFRFQSDHPSLLPRRPGDLSQWRPAWVLMRDPVSDEWHTYSIIRQFHHTTARAHAAGIIRASSSRGEHLILRRKSPQDSIRTHRQMHVKPVLSDAPSLWEHNVVVGSIWVDGLPICIPQIRWPHVGCGPDECLRQREATKVLRLRTTN